MSSSRPYLLTIAGFDPSSGAGLTADIKTMEAMGGYGLAVCSANTVQNDTSFTACYWTDFEVMEQQINLLFERFTINTVKIGIVKDWHTLGRLVALLQKHEPKIQVVLDPVLRSSSSFDFHGPQAKELEEVASQLYLITPNYQEIQVLYPGLSAEEAAKKLSLKTAVLLKGGHHPSLLGTDILYQNGEETLRLSPSHTNVSAKHGSGCVLSSAIATALANGHPLAQACSQGKAYTAKVLASNTSLLGYHF
jgi:hydroxymethylpyrimidine/phosphomethylpyrimidine kinase